ncbi:hypothetical protein WMQ45_22795 [Vibrio diabolicus]|uniref:hypothetical protein n=1 Tax=Vibrio diabolicus TaxID=50719 RepID=UPI003751DC26
MCSRKNKDTDKTKEQERSKLLGRRAAAILKARQEKGIVDNVLAAEAKRAIASKASTYQARYYFSRKATSKKELTKEEFAELIAKKCAY